MALHSPRFAGLLAFVTLLVTASLLAAKGLNLAVDFAGGMVLEVRHPEAQAPASMAPASIQDTLVRAGFAEAIVKEIDGNPSDFLIVFPPSDQVLSPQSAPRVVQRVMAALRQEQPGVEATRVEIVTPKIGGEVLLFGAESVILACAAIMIYPAVRYGWRTGLSAAVTTLRNMAIILGLLLSAYAVFQWEFSLLSMTAVGFLAVMVTAARAACASRSGRA